MIARRSFLAGLATPFLASGSFATALDYAPAAMNDGWPVTDPVSAGLDPNALADLADMMQTGVTVPNVHALLIERRGQLVFERYKPGEDYAFGNGPLGIVDLGVVDHGPTTLHDIRSISKTVTAMVLGAALGDSADDLLQRPLPDLLPDRSGFGAGVENVTLHHVLTMTSGLPWNESFVPYDSDRNDFTRMTNTDDPVGLVLGRDVQTAPGTEWLYSSGSTEVLGAVIEALTGQSLEAFTRATLFAPLGIDAYDWYRPDSWPEDHFPSASAGLRLRARDLAKIGSVLLRRGAWQGARVLPASWIDRVVTRHLPALPGMLGRVGYGYQVFPGTHINGNTVIRAIGSGGQRVFVLPDDGLSITVNAGNYVGPRWEVGEKLLARILRTVL